jgi:hypothetical protein
VFGIKHVRGAYGLLWLDVVVRVSITAESGPAGPSTKLITGVTKAKKASHSDKGHIQYASSLVCKQRTPEMTSKGDSNTQKTIRANRKNEIRPSENPTKQQILRQQHHDPNNIPISHQGEAEPRIMHIS